jgi:hypothetical protein
MGVPGAADGDRLNARPGQGGPDLVVLRPGGLLGRGYPLAILVGEERPRGDRQGSKRNRRSSNKNESENYTKPL